MADPCEGVSIRGTGVTVSRLGLGTAPLGSLFSEVTDADAEATLAAAFAAGITYVDTAPLYGYGLAEERVGRTRAHTQVAISTKVGRLPRRGAAADLSQLVDGASIWSDDRGLGIVRDYSRAGIEASLAESRERLGVDRIDIALVHDPEDVVDQVIGETIPALAEMRDHGAVGAIGIGSGRPDVILRIVREVDVDVVMCASGLSVMELSPPADLLSLCSERGTLVIAAGVFRSGLLADPSPGARLDYGAAEESDISFVRSLREVCTAHGVSLHAAALQYPLRLPAVACVVAGMRNPAEVAAAVRAFRQPIPEAAWSAVREIASLKVAS
jgi:D-threo-aldose 1-dehydrogenase